MAALQQREDKKVERSVKSVEGGYQGKGALDRTYLKRAALGDDSFEPPLPAPAGPGVTLEMLESLSGVEVPL